eukprot:CAMPEP_0117551884 /NCGR_PEP_ID=MMETSP0784-20121206/49419_1 /TAXON_ID=39447 /ORGANISM="" /LENGTH=108 /DNA_ID=CAMNT_0005348933 /DNA_START=65 /DNA_END=388 /DNA_ORIENTATION=-
MAKTAPSALSLLLVAAFWAFALSACSWAFVGQPALRGTAQAPPGRFVAMAAAAGNLGGDFWEHPWAQELASNPKGEDITFDDVVAHFNSRREAEGLLALEEGSSPLVI